MKNQLMTSGILIMLLFTSCYTEVRQGAAPRRRVFWHRRAPRETIIIHGSIKVQPSDKTFCFTSGLAENLVNKKQLK